MGKCYLKNLSKAKLEGDLHPAAEACVHVTWSTPAAENDEWESGDSLLTEKPNLILLPLLSHIGRKPSYFLSFGKIILFSRPDYRGSKRFTRYTKAMLTLK